MRPASTGWSLQQRVNRAIALVLALILLLVAIVVGALVSAKERGDEVIERWDPAVLARQRAIAGMISQETGVRGFALGKRENFLDAYDVGVQPIAESFDRLESSVAGERDLEQQVAAFRGAYDSWRTEVALPLIDRTRADDPQVAQEAVSEDNKARFDEVRDIALDLNDALIARSEQAQEARTRAFWWVWAAVGVGVALLLGVSLALVRGLRRQVLAPIDGLVAQTRAVADGHRDQQIVQPGPREIESLAADVDSMRAELLRQLEQVDRSRVRLQQRGAELARSNADLEQFAYVASHDLSEPLRKVTNFCQLLERQYADQLDDRARTYIGFSVDGAKRMQVLITDLLAFSRVGRTTEHFTDVPLDAALARALSDLDAQLEASGAVVEADPLPTVPGDATLLTALLQNLVSNAVKYRDPERTPHVRITVEPTTEAGADAWLLTVSDNGIGIEPQYAERIFTIFQRLHLRDQYGGTGIGLALCRKIVDFHRGRIWLAESGGPGARFQFTLPLVQAPLGTGDDDEIAQPAHA